MLVVILNLSAHCLVSSAESCGRQSRLTVDYDASIRRRVQVLDSTEAQTRPWLHPENHSEAAFSTRPSSRATDFRSRAIYADLPGCPRGVGGGISVEERTSTAPALTSASGNLIIERLMVRRQLHDSVRQQDRLTGYERHAMTRHSKNRAERKSVRQWQRQIAGEEEEEEPALSRRPLVEISNGELEENDRKELLEMYVKSGRKQRNRDWEQEFNNLIEEPKNKSVNLTSVSDWEKRFLSEI